MALAVVGQRPGILPDEICSSGKNAQLVYAKEVFLLSGRCLGTSLSEMSRLLGLDDSTVSRRHDAAKRRMKDDPSMKTEVENVVSQYRSL